MLGGGRVVFMLSRFAPSLLLLAGAWGCSEAAKPSDPAGNAGTASTSGGSSSGSSSGGSSSAGASGGAIGGSSAVAGQAGAGGASGSVSAGSSSGGTGQAEGLCPANALFCDDFEDGNLDGWKKKEAGGTLTIGAQQAVSGSHALTIEIPAGKQGGFLELSGAPLFPLPGKLIWGRAFVYFDNAPDGHTDIFRGAAADGQIPWYNVGEQHGEILLNYYNGNAEDCWARPKPGKVVPLETWMCWEFSFDGNADEIQFFIDGELSRKVTKTGDGCGQGTPTWAAPTFASLQVGEYIAQVSDTPSKMYIDDVAVGTASRLGCPVAKALN